MILFVGQLIPIKGVDQLLTAWKQFKSHCKENCTLVYVGYGRLEQPLRDRIVNEKIQDVILIGALTMIVLPNIIKLQIVSSSLQ